MKIKILILLLFMLLIMGCTFGNGKESLMEESKESDLTLTTEIMDYYDSENNIGIISEKILAKLFIK